MNREKEVKKEFLTLLSWFVRTNVPYPEKNEALSFEDRMTVSMCVRAFMELLGDMEFPVFINIREDLQKYFEEKESSNAATIGDTEKDS